MTRALATSVGIAPDYASGRVGTAARRDLTEFTPQPGDLAPSARRALRRAAAAAQHSGSASTDDGPAVTERAAVTEAVVTAIESAATGRAPKAHAMSPCASIAPLLGSIRRGLLAQTRLADRPLSLQDLVSLLDAIEKVQESTDRDSARRVAEHLAGPSARQLVMEIAHDMRSPLASVLFLVETLRSERSGSLTSVQQRQLGIIYSAAFGISAMATDLIELAHGGSRLIDGPATPFSISAMLRSVQEMIEPIAEEKGLTLRVDSAEGDSRLGHQAALGRILLNLATNALKFTPSGSVSICARPLGPARVEFSVTDTGPGIPPAVERTLYQAFRARSCADAVAFSSAGLGLAICQRLVVSLGSELVVDSRLGSGTRFSFVVDLPLSTMMESA